MQEMDQWAMNWLQARARKEYWRVAAWHDVDDLIQDGVFFYYRVVRHYPHVTERRHLMGLFQRAFINHIHNLSKHRTRMVEEIVDVPEGYDPLYALEQLHEDGADVPFEHLLHEAPPEARMVLELLLRDPSILLRPYRRRKRQRETLNARLCRMLNLTYEIDLVTPTYDYLKGRDYKVPRLKPRRAAFRVRIKAAVIEELRKSFKQIDRSRTREYVKA